jgi:hypothetical protein
MELRAQVLLLLVVQMAHKELVLRQVLMGLPTLVVAAVAARL